MPAGRLGKRAGFTDGLGFCFTIVGIVISVIVGWLMPGPGEGTSTLVWPILLSAVAGLGILVNLVSAILFSILFITKRGALRIVAVVLNLAMAAWMAGAIHRILSAPKEFHW